ncbi:MAG TPA: DUF1223 domain-containing protein [Burkholderiales bacterium]|nr:DUF1223 domain-containing protein [Burkholderiales bacterium]
MLVLVGGLGLAAAAGAAPCVARSGQHTAALVELYTAQRCSGCLHAERWLSALARRAAGEVVPLALLVDYADYLGGEGSAAEGRLVRRERRLVPLQRTALVYTPQVLLQGRDFPAWRDADIDAALTRVAASPARARLKIEIASAGWDGLAVRVDAAVLDPAQRRDAVLYVAAVSRRKGEAPVALEWQGPLVPGADGRLSEARRLALVPGTAPGSSGAAAFVQNRRTADVLQALLLAACSP